MIRFEHVWFSYGQKVVLRDVSLDIGARERVAILGGSGEGKTTILRLILGLIRPDAGKITIEGEDITQLDEAALRPIRRQFSIVFQEGALFDSLTVRGNIAFVLRETGSLSEEAIERKVEELLKVVDMEDASALLPDELSGGMKRRAAIARSLAACCPKMFLYDEPTTGLDPVNADNICRLILRLSEEQGSGLIVVTHKVLDAFRVARRFLFLLEGRIVFDGDREALLRSDLPRLRAFLEDLRWGAAELASKP